MARPLARPSAAHRPLQPRSQCCTFPCKTFSKNAILCRCTLLPSKRKQNTGPLTAYDGTNVTARNSSHHNVTHEGAWRNGSASDSRSEGWEFESLCPHFRISMDACTCIVSFPASHTMHNGTFSEVTLRRTIRKWLHKTRSWPSDFETDTSITRHAASNASPRPAQATPSNDKVVPRGLEPRTLRLLAVRSNQLSYETN